MSEIKLTADSGGGTTSIKAPSTTTSNADVVLKLPVADGSSGQVIKTDGSGQLSFTSNAGTTINNNGDNRVITGSGTASTLNGESNFTFDGTDVVAIGTATSGSYDSNQKLRIGRASDCNIAIRTTGNTTSHTGISFGDDDTSEAGFIKYYHNDNSLRVQTNASERMRIDSSGNVLVGGTSLGAAGSFGMESHGHVRSILASGTTGDTLFGAISGVSNGFQINISGTNSQMYRFHNGSTVTAQIDSDGLKFKNDTAAANALDDYEEGNWTPQIKGTTGAGTATYNTQTGKYLKIGNFVYLTAELNWSSGSAGGELRITDLPFSPTTDCEGIGNAMFNNVTIGGDTANISPYVGPANNYMYFYQSRQGTQTWKTLDYDSGGAIIMNVAFRVA